MLCLGGREKGIRVAGAISLKNFLKAHWNAEGVMSRDERLEFRNQLVDVVLRVDDLVRKPLAESVSDINTILFVISHISSYFQRAILSGLALPPIF